jgi:hypothetical protein
MPLEVAWTATPVRVLHRPALAVPPAARPLEWVALAERWVLRELAALWERAAARERAEPPEQRVLQVQAARRDRRVTPELATARTQAALSAAVRQITNEHAAMKSARIPTATCGRRLNSRARFCAKCAAKSA